MDVREKLVQATETAEVLEIIYHGGIQPGKSRKIAPISVKDGKVRARCYSSNAVKVFNLDKIELAATQSIEEWEAGRVEPIQYSSLGEIYDQNVEQLKQLGWHVIIGDSELTLHRMRKNGNPLKGSDVQLYYEEYSSDLVVGLDGELREENVRKRSRPFGVRAKNFETKTFSTLDKAAPIFMAQAKKLSPES